MAQDTFIVRSVDEFFDVANGTVLLKCVDDSMVMIAAEEYVDGKRKIAKALGIAPGEVSLDGMTLTLDSDGAPVIPA